MIIDSRNANEMAIIAEADRQIAVYQNVITLVQMERDALAECAGWVIEQWERGNLVCHTPDSSALVRMRSLVASKTLERAEVIT